MRWGASLDRAYDHGSRSRPIVSRKHLRDKEAGKVDSLPSLRLCLHLFHRGGLCSMIVSHKRGMLCHRRKSICRSIVRDVSMHDDHLCGRCQSSGSRRTLGHGRR
jgi:hypothetical protein